MENVTAITKAQPAPIAFEFSPEQRKMIRDSFANGASDSEFAVLMEVAKARRLNPLMRQIYFVKRWDGAKRCEVWSTQISIDGLRAVAERTGAYDGQSEPVYEYDKDGKVTKCTVHVFRKDWTSGHSAVGVAFFAEYAQHKKDGELTSFWATKPHIMLAKCAEALAIRKAFPEDTSGLYVPEEMGEEPAIEAKAEPAKVEPPKPEPKGLPPPHVMALWNRIQKDWPGKGTPELKRATLELAKTVPGFDKKPTTEWTEDDAKAVEKILWPDIPF